MKPVGSAAGLDRLRLGGFIGFGVWGFAPSYAVNVWEGFVKWKCFVARALGDGNACGKAWKAPCGSQWWGQQLRFSEGGGSMSTAGMPGTLRLGQSWALTCFQTEQRRAVLPNLDHVGREGEQGTECARGHVRYGAAGGAEATDPLGADETRPLSKWTSSFCRCFWLGEITLDTGGSETALGRLKWLWLPPPQTGILQKPVAS